MSNWECFKRVDCYVTQGTSFLDDSPVFSKVIREYEIEVLNVD